MNSTLPYLWKQDAHDSSSLVQLFQQRLPQIKDQLQESGAVLFRGFEIDDGTKLEQSVAAFPGDPISYTGGNSPRTNLHGQVYTSTEFPANAFISLHNEMSYAKHWPRYIFFCCHTPALQGGETPIADSRKILLGLSQKVRDAFESKDVKYIRNLHGGLGAGPSWQKTFETDNRQKVEEHCRASDISFEWYANDTLRLTEKRKGIITHPETGQKVWFNQADQFHPSTNASNVFNALMKLYAKQPHSMPQYACFDDDSEIPLEMLDEIREVTKNTITTFPWNKGDLLLMDNILASHGRMPFQGPRKILVSMLS